MQCVCGTLSALVLCVSRTMLCCIFSALVHCVLWMIQCFVDLFQLWCIALHEWYNALYFFTFGTLCFMNDTMLCCILSAFGALCFMNDTVLRETLDCECNWTDKSYREHCCWQCVKLKLNPKTVTSAIQIMNISSNGTVDRALTESK